MSYFSELPAESKTKAKPKEPRQVTDQNIGLGIEFFTVKNTFKLTPERRGELYAKHYMKDKLPKGFKSVNEYVRANRGERVGSA